VLYVPLSGAVAIQTYRDDECNVIYFPFFHFFSVLKNGLTQ
jgi:hypothetical protein